MTRASHRQSGPDQPLGRRLLAVWLPRLPTDRLVRHWRRRDPRRAAMAAASPLVTVVSQGNRHRVDQANDIALLAGLAPGLLLADARALEPALIAVPADPATDARALDGLAAWAERYTPWVGCAGAPPLEAGLMLDISGCAHLFGGEAALLDDMIGRLTAMGLTGRAAIAGTPGAAWAIARVGPARQTGEDGRASSGASSAASFGAIVPPGGEAAALAPLAIKGLRLPGPVVDGLMGLGLKRIGQLADIPRAELTRRYGPPALRRLDQALGRAGETVDPRRPTPRFAAQLSFADAIGRTEDVAAGIDRLLARVCDQLIRAGRGGRRFALGLVRVDGSVERLQVGTHVASRDAAVLARLFADRLDGIDCGFGIEAVELAVRATDRVSPAQCGLAAEGDGAGELDVLVDRLGNRLGARALGRLVPRQSHWPEAAVVVQPVSASRPPTDWPAPDWPATGPGGGARPVCLVEPPEPVEVTAPIPDDPPILFRRAGVTHRVARADGPERLEPEWWPGAPGGGDGQSRDYYRVEDHQGRRFWLFRAGRYGPEQAPRWFLHGLFG